MKTILSGTKAVLPSFIIVIIAGLFCTWALAQNNVKRQIHKAVTSHERPVVSKDPVVVNGANMIKEGREIFRYDTYGDEAFWGDVLGLHKAIEGTTFGGVGPGVAPSNALALGLKVDADALPPKLISDLKRGKVNLGDPAVTLTLIKLNAVLGVKGAFNPDGSLKNIGLTCAVCHSTVNDSIAPGIESLTVE
jgi:hypothetical protein